MFNLLAVAILCLFIGCVLLTRAFVLILTISLVAYDAVVNKKPCTFSFEASWWYLMFGLPIFTLSLIWCIKLTFFP